MSKSFSFSANLLQTGIKYISSGKLYKKDFAKPKLSVIITLSLTECGKRATFDQYTGKQRLTTAAT